MLLPFHIMMRALLHSRSCIAGTETKMCFFSGETTTIPYSLKKNRDRNFGLKKSPCCSSEYFVYSPMARDCLLPM